MRISGTLPVKEQEQANRLNFVHKLAYGVGDVEPALVAMLSGVLLNAFLLTSARLRSIFLIVKMWDGVNDPLIGTLADRTNIRWGRQRPWLLLVMVLTAVNFPLTALTPEIASGGNERTSRNTFCFSFSILGVMTALISHDTIMRFYIFGY